MAQDPQHRRQSRVAVMTMARDERHMLPLWVAHHGRQVGYSALLVLDDNSTDGSTDDLPCPVVRLPPGPWKRPWNRTRLQMVNAFARGLLACYDAVVFTDTDELLLPDPRVWEDLEDYVARGPQAAAVAPLAVEVMHHEASEPPLDPAHPVLEQRSFVKYSPGMCKPLVKRVPEAWTGAFHRISTPFEVDPSLLMLHLKYADAGVVEEVGDLRQRIHTEEDRGHPASFWPLGGARLRGDLAAWTAEAGGADALPELDVAALDLEGMVVPQEDGTWRAAARQVSGLKEHPLRRVPAHWRATG